jgi:hypothetical protein
VLTVRPISLEIAGFTFPDDCLPAFTYVDMLDPNELLAPMPKPSKDLDLCRIGSQQPSRSRSKGCHPSLVPISTFQSGQDRHGGCMRAGHLDRQSCLHLIPRSSGLDHGERGLVEGCPLRCDAIREMTSGRAVLHVAEIAAL